MNILFIEIASDGTIGGSHTCLYNLVNNLDRSKYKIWVGFYQNNPYADKLREMGFNVILLDRDAVWGGNILIRKIRNWYRLIYKPTLELRNIIFKNQIDLVVLNNSIVLGNVVIKSCNKLNIPIIAYERGYSQYCKSDISLSNRINAAIAVSCAIQSNMLQQKYSANIRMIYDGLTINNDMSTSEILNRHDIKHSIGIPDNSLVIGIIGNIKEWKGQEYFLKAFMALGEKYSNIYGLVIGGHTVEDEAYLISLKKIAESSVAGKRLVFLGFRDDVPKLLLIFDVFIHASITPEPFGMVLLEAMLNKVPVIATNFGGPIEILANGDCGILVPPRDENAIVDGVEKYINDALFREEMVSRAYMRIKNEFDLRKTVNQVDDLFQEVVNEARA